MRRVSVKQLIEATGLSRSTIERALNGRQGVHPRTREVIDAALRHLGTASPRDTPHSHVTAPATEVDFVLRLGRGLMEQITFAAEAAPGVALHDMVQKDDAEIARLVRRLCEDVSRPLVITAKNSDVLRGELERARRRGKRVVALVSDLAQDARDAFVGIDNRMAGQTAAALMGRVLGGRSARVGVVIGDYAFSCHEDREIGFRSALRAHFPGAAVVDEAQGEDSVERTYQAVAAMLVAHPGLDALYNVAGGNAGLARAVREAGRAADLLIVAHEANRITAPLLREGVIDFVLAQDPEALFRRSLEAALAPPDTTAKGPSFVDFGMYMRFNMPGFALI